MSSAGHIMDMIARLKSNDIVRRSRANYRTPNDGVIRISDSNTVIEVKQFSEERRKAVIDELQYALKVRRIKLCISLVVLLAFVVYVMIYLNMFAPFYL